MDKSTKIVIAGVITAGVIIGVGPLNTQRLESVVKQLELECSKKNQALTEGLKLPEPERWKTVCEAKELNITLIRYIPKERIQARIIQAQKEVNDSKKWPYAIAAAIFIFSLLPWFWYFLLRRIKELRNAIMGK